MKQIKIADRLEKKYTLRTNSTDKYLTEVSRYSVLTPEEEYQVAVKARAGDSKSLEKLIYANLRFVISVAKRYSSTPEMLNELIAEGNIGLIDSAKTFDPSLGFKFISYAVWNIRKEILKHLSTTKEIIRLPGHVVRDISKIKKIESDLTCILDREPTADEIYEHVVKQNLDISLDKIDKLRLLSTAAIPFETNDEDGPVSPSQWVESDSSEFNMLDDTDTRTILNMALGVLDFIERDIVERYHGINRERAESFVDIANDYERSSEWARLRYKKAMLKLKRKSRNLI